MVDAKKTGNPSHVYAEISPGAYRITVLPKNPPQTQLTPGVYVLNYHETQTEAFYYLTASAEYKLPERIYGNVTSNIAHFFKSFCLNDRNLGLLLIGERGSGKTITLKAMAQQGIGMGMIVILINQPYRGDMFVNFLASIKQECMICFDEFCKTYSQLSDHGQVFASKGQDSILQILDGVSSAGKKMFVLTANDSHLVSQYLQDRPGRIRYMIKFNHMEVETVESYVKEKLVKFTDEHLGAFVHMALAQTYDKVGMNFDSMAEFVTEMNQFDYDLDQCLEIMASKGKKTNAYFEVKILKNGQEITSGHGGSEHQGAYLKRDDFKLKIGYFITPEEGKPAQETKVELDRSHFVGYFNGNKKILELHQNDLVFVCTYVDRDTNRAKVDEVQEKISGSSPWRRGFGRSDPY